MLNGGNYRKHDIMTIKKQQKVINQCREPSFLFLREGVRRTEGFKNRNPLLLLKEENYKRNKRYYFCEGRNPL